jgi:hypothetical protein
MNILYNFRESTGLVWKRLASYFYYY